jgi:hypothetical protein
MYMIEVNYVIILVCAALSMIVGAIWYGTLFGKKWMWLMNVDPNNREQMEKMKKESMPLYGIQLILSLLQVYVLFHYIKGAEDEMSATSNVIWIWLGFIVVTLASSCIWTNESNERKWTRFLIQAGYQLVMFLIFGYVIGTYG